MSGAARRDRAAGEVHVGLMSGTSLDGISAAVARFAPAGPASDDPRLAVELLGFVQRPYTPEERARLAAALIGGTAAEYCRLAFDLGGWFADAALAAISASGVPREEVRAIGSHGQTIWHEAPHSTWQLGEAAVIAERTGIDVVSDFRVRDVAAGGQGAPLVPIADALLFAAPGAWRLLQNIGGIGNVTVVPPAGRQEGLVAFDTGPGVAVLDGVVRRLEPGLPYDVDGRLAAAGTPIEPVVAERLAHPYFAARPPKSTGRELFTPAYIERFVADCRAARPDATTSDIVATAVWLTARSIADQYVRWVTEPNAEVLLSGGGARHPVLVAMIRRLLAPRPVALFDERFFDGEAKEAVAFALLAWLHVHGRAGNVPAATGAPGPRVLGKLTPR